MKAYLDILQRILESGEEIPNRTGVSAKAIFGTMFEHDMRTGFPMLTTKKMAVKSIFAELEGFIKGITSKRWYQERKCYIWDEWCNPQELKKYDWNDLNSVFEQVKKNQIENPSLSPKVDKAIADIIGMQSYATGFEHDYDVLRKLVQLYEDDLGPIYGYQWRKFDKPYIKMVSPNDTVDLYQGVDQFDIMLNTLKQNPTDRRMLVVAWNPKEVQNNSIALPACHWAFEIHSNGSEFDLIWHQRSCDYFIGIPYNISSYAMLMKLIEKETGKTARYLKGFFGNTHVYMNHVDQSRLLLSREPKQLPTLSIPDVKWNGIYDWNYTDYEISGYDPHPAISAQIAV